MPTEHHSNIFCARFLPLSCDYRLVSCAGNGTVQYTEVDPTGSYLGHMFNCHTSITYQVATSPVDRHEFLSCEEKGLVRLFDLRAKNKCNCSGCDVVCVLWGVGGVGVLWECGGVGVWVHFVHVGVPWGCGGMDLLWGVSMWM